MTAMATSGPDTVEPVDGRWQQPVQLVHRRDDRFVAYSIVVAGALVIALFSGRAELAAFAAPFAIALALGRRNDDSLSAVALTVEFDEDRAIEGDTVTGRFGAQSTVPLRGGVTVELLARPSSDLTILGPVDGVLGCELVAGGGHHPAADFAVRAERWGSFLLAPTAVRVRDPYSLTYWEGRALGGPRLMVLPTAARLSSLLEPRSSRAMAGFHTARRSVGHGLDFAELQHYQPGDRLRDLNRAATARTGTPIVNRYHPERAGEVVVLLDTFIDPSYELSTTSRQAIVVSVRAAWAIARAHLAAQDRVGVTTVGRVPVWLSPAGGARARYTVLETLLSVGDALESGRVRADPVDAGRIPPAALVVFISPLWDGRYLPHIERLQARGRETAVIQLGTGHLIAEPTTPNEELARRLFDITVEDRAERLRRSGITVVRWERGASLDAVVDAAAQRQAQRRMSRSG